MLDNIYIKIIITLLISITGYFIAKKLKFPAPAMIGSMLGVGIFNIIFDIAYMPTSFRTFTQGIAGMFVGLSISKEEIRKAKTLIKPILLLCLFFTINTFFTGILIHKLCGIDLVTALYSCIAGGVSDVPLIAMDMGAEASTVAVLQSMRLIVTLVVFPAWVAFFTKDVETEEVDNKDALTKRTSNNSKMINNIISVILAFIFGYIGKLINIPAGSLIVSMLATTLLHWYLPIIRCDRKIKTTAQLFAGAIVGSSINQATFTNLPNLIMPVIILIGSYWLINLLYGKYCSKKGILDLKTAMFAACPAGASDMALIASDLGADLTKVSLIQVLRLIFSIAVVPQLVLLFIKLIS